MNLELVRPEQGLTAQDVSAYNGLTSGQAAMVSHKRAEESAMGKQFSLQIDEDLCKACGICVDFCPKEVFKTSELISRRGYYIPAVVREGECMGCRLCELLCPELAILVTETEHQPESLAEGK